MIKLGNILQYLKSDWLIWFTPSDTSSLAKKGSVIEEQFLIMLVQNKTRLFAGVVRPGAHLGGLFGCHDRPLCTAGRLLSIKADDEIWNAVTAGLYGGWFGTGNSLHFPSESRIQRYANKEVATISPPFHNIPHRSHVLFAWHSFHILITVPFCCDQKAQAANALSFTLWQQATIEITCHDHCIIACSHHIYILYGCCSSCTSCSWWIAHSTQCQWRGCNNIPSFLQQTTPIASSFCEVCTWHNLLILVTTPFCCDRKAQAANMQSFTLWRQATIEITCHDHSIISCPLHIYVVLFFAHISLMVNLKFNKTPTERLQQA